MKTPLTSNIKVIRCPKCGRRTVHVLIDADNKTYKCKNCGTCVAG